MSDYTEKFKDPKWQRRRLEIMKRDHFTCCVCYDEKETLNVHHKYYLPNHDPWEYPDNALITLCVLCHEREKKELPKEVAKLIQTIKMKGFMSDDIVALNNSIYDMPLVDVLWVQNSVIYSILTDKKLIQRRTKKELSDMGFNKNDG